MDEFLLSNSLKPPVIVQSHFFSLKKQSMYRVAYGIDSWTVDGPI